VQSPWIADPAYLLDDDTSLSLLATVGARALRKIDTQPIEKK
jgi:hypothetical protein